MALCSPARGQLRAACPHAHRTPPPARVTSTSAARRSYGMHRLCTTTRSTVVCPASVQHAPSSEGPTDPPDSSQPAVAAHATFLAALKDNKLAELVIGEQMGLGTATNMCFEVLGIASKPPDQQRSAARSLVSLCTHPDLRPAVDPQLVLRRLGRVVECTRAPAALGAALEALVAVANDAGWEHKDGAGAVAELLREGVFRCVSVIEAAASTPEPTNVALAEAALAAFTSKRLCALLNEQQQVEATRAVSRYMAAARMAGSGSLGAPLSALHTLLTADCRGGDSWPVPYDMGLAVVSSGAAVPLLAAMEAGSSSKAGSGAQGPNTGLVALRCLGMSIVACMQGGRPKGQAAVRAALTAAGLQHAVGTSLRYTDASPAEGSVLALDVLLAAVACCGGEAVEAVVTRVREELPAAGASTLPLLSAAEALIQSCDAGLTAESASALLQLLTAMCASGLVKAAAVLEALPGIRDAIAGVLLQETPGSEWKAFNAIVIEQTGRNRYTYPLMVEAAALRLLDQLSQGMGLGGSRGFGMELARLAAALVHGVLEAKLPGELESYTLRLRCLVAVLQAIGDEEAGLWYVNNSVSSGGGGGGSSSATATPDQQEANGVSFGDLVALAHKLSDSLEKEVWNGVPHTAAATTYTVTLRAAAVVTAASWSAVCKEEVANQQHNQHHSYPPISLNGGYKAVVGEAHRAVCRLLVRSLAAVSSDSHVIIGTAGSIARRRFSAKGSSTNIIRLTPGQLHQALGCAADVLNAAVKCLQQAEISGGGLTQLPTIESLQLQQQQTKTTAMAMPGPINDFKGILGLVTSNSSQLERLTSAHKYPGVTARELVAGVRGAQQRVLDLASAALTEEGEGPEADKLRKLLCPALAVSRNAGQMLGKALQAYC